MELKFKNAMHSVLYLACFSTILSLFLGGICILVTCIWENGNDLMYCLIGFPCFIIAVWLLSAIVIMLNKTVIVTSEEIKLCRGKKIKWSIKKEDIEECIYNEMKWYYFLVPISTINAYTLQFKLKEKMKISKEFCSLSLKQVQKIKETFNYPIRQIQSISEQ